MADVTSSTSTTTGISGAGGGNMVRITGMASGLDVDALVKKMLTADQIKIDSATQANQTVQWKKDAYTSIITGIKDLQTSFFDVTDSSTSVLSDTAYSAFSASVVNPSTAASISTDSTAQPGAYTISFRGDTGHLASAATVTGITTDPLVTIPVAPATPVAASNSTKLSELGFASNHTMTISYVNNGGATQSAIISFSPTDTLSTLTTSINTATGNSVNARFSELTGQLSVQSSATGENSNITVSSEEGVLSTLKLGASTAWTTTSLSSIGRDAQVWITPPGGSETSVQRSSNNFSIDGVSYNLTVPVDSTFSVVTDPQKVYDKISGFLDKYNTLVDQIQTAVNAKKDSDYPPLTAAQQTAMSATDIANWNIKAQVGSLSNDKNLTKMLNDMRTAFTSLVNKTGLTFGKYGTNAIGLDTSSTDVTQGGKITIVDKAKLMSAITNHPAQVQQFFSNVSTDTNSSAKFSNQGIFSRINDIITNNVGLIGNSFNTAVLTQYANNQDDYSTTGGTGKNTLPDQLYYQQLLITQLNKNMSADQTKYYNQFTNLETAMNNMSAQMSMISSFSTNVGG